jgi:hypothetical protein
MSIKFPTTISFIEYLNGLDATCDKIDNLVFNAFVYFFHNKKITKKNRINHQ